MKNRLIGLVYCILALGFFPSALAQARTGILVLGSADLVTLQERIQLAYNLYQQVLPDYVILSGGCAAHQSSICEADLMFEHLVDKGVPAERLVKEGNAKTTVQNYLYAKELTDAQGQLIIQQGDLLYVVSNHWHAIAVAARFVQHDAVNAVYYIQGKLQPKAKDPVDYVGILYETTDPSEFRTKGMWPSPDGLLSINAVDYYLFQDRWLSNPSGSSLKTNTLDWLQQIQISPQAAIAQDKDQLYLIADKHIKAYRIGTGTLSSSMPLKDAIVDYPKEWLLKPIDAACIIADTLYLFQEDKLLIAKRKGKVYVTQAVMPILQQISNWPFSWGKGWLNAAHYNPKTKTISLYRNRECLQLDAAWQPLASPQRLALDWADFKQELNSK